MAICCHFFDFFVILCKEKPKKIFVSFIQILNVAYSFFNVLRSNEQGKSLYKKSD